MAENDLALVLPDENGIRACDLAAGELSRFAVAVVDEVDAVYAKR